MLCAHYFYFNIWFDYWTQKTQALNITLFNDMVNKAQYQLWSNWFVYAYMSGKDNEMGNRTKVNNTNGDVPVVICK